MRTHDVFLSYASDDKAVADAVVARLESRGVRCWYAPRDIVGGMSYAKAIVDAIRRARVMVLVLSDSSNRSDQVTNEVERAVHHKLPVIPFRIDPVEPTGDLEYFVSRKHWLDALPPPAKAHVERLAETVELLLKHTADRSQEDDEARSATSRPPARRRSRLVLAGVAIVLLAAAGWYVQQRSSVSPAVAGSDLRSNLPTADPAEGSVSDSGETPAPTAAGSGEVDSPPVNVIPRSEHRLGFDGPLSETTSHTAPEDGRLQVTVRNRSAAGSKAAMIETFRVDGRRQGRCGPGVSKDSRWFTVDKDQRIEIEVAAHAGHSVVYELELRFQSLRDLGLVWGPEDGILDANEHARLGFDGTASDRWTFRPPADGRLQVHLSDLIPRSTELGQIETFTVDGQPHGRCGPGVSKDSSWLTVRKDQPIDVEVGAAAGHSVVYELEPRFESLDALGLVPGPEDGILDGDEQGALGFDGSSSDTWTFRAPAAGRLQVHLTNLIPRGTEGGRIETFTVDGKPHGRCGPGVSKDSPWLMLGEGQEVKIEVGAAAGHSVVYRLEPRFDR